MTTNMVYLLKLHESCVAGKYTVTRVPGGWLYYREREHASLGGYSCTATCTFVPFPYNNEDELNMES
jgi:hypothetical protein